MGLTKLPDGVDKETARMAIAWEIAAMAFHRIPDHMVEGFNEEGYIREFTKLYRWAYKWLLTEPESEY